MKPISKQEFLKLLDSYLPDDAMLSGFSGHGDCFELNNDTLSQVMLDINDEENEIDESDYLAGSTHVLVTL